MNRFDFIKRYGGIFLLAVAVIIFYKLFDSLGIVVNIFNTILSVFTPIVIGGVLAYFLLPIAKMFERKFEKTTGFFHNNKRLLSVLIAFFIFVLIIALTLVYFIPILANTVVDLTGSMNTYLQDFEANAANIIKDETILNFVVNMEKEVVQFMETWASKDPTIFIASVFSAANTFITMLLGLVFCPYILIERDNLLSLFNRISAIFISQNKLDVIHEYTYKCHKIFDEFVYGKFIDSVIIGAIALVGFGLLGLKFFPLLALVVLVTNMVPYFGPFIGGIPVVLFTLLTSGFGPAIWTALFIFALQQFDGLILGPAILGETVGISPFWIIFAITVFGGLFGFIGMFLGVPLICIIRMFFNDYMAYRKRRKEMVS
ncbi:MAG: AI-2E family transporter [Coprobacillaceae bacterium]